MDPKLASLRNLQREKDHPPPPPPLVREPDTANGGKGEEFVIGRPLGKGGFAICYEGQAKGRNEKLPGRRYALKIVKAAMPNPKLADKVGIYYARKESHD